jgi:hypothetical protein
VERARSSPARRQGSLGAKSHASDSTAQGAELRRGPIKPCEVGNSGAQVHHGIYVPNVGLLAVPFVALVPGMPRFGRELPGTVGIVSSRIRHSLFSPDGTPAASPCPCWQPGHITAQAEEQIHYRRMEVLVRDSDPEVQRVAAGSAGKAVPHVFAQVRGKGTAGPRPMHRAGSTQLVAATGPRRKAEEIEHLEQAHA